MSIKDRVLMQKIIDRISVAAEQDVTMKSIFIMTDIYELCKASKERMLRDYVRAKIAAVNPAYASGYFKGK